MKNVLYMIIGKHEYSGKFLRPTGSGYDEEGNATIIGTVDVSWGKWKDNYAVPLANLKIYAEWETKGE